MAEVKHFSTIPLASPSPDGPCWRSAVVPASTLTIWLLLVSCNEPQSPLCPVELQMNLREVWSFIITEKATTRVENPPIPYDISAGDPSSTFNLQPSLWLYNVKLRKGSFGALVPSVSMSRTPKHFSSFVCLQNMRSGDHQRSQWAGKFNLELRNCLAVRKNIFLIQRGGATVIIITDTRVHLISLCFRAICHETDARN